MAIARRDFIRSGVAVAAVAVVDCGCNSLTVHAPPNDTGGGWDQVPAILARIVPPQFPDRDFNVTDYGAAGDGHTDCYPAFAAAIAACNKAGGGRVVVPAARRVYIVNGPIRLLSNVNLHLEEGAVIQFGIDPANYLPVVLVRYQGIRCYNYSPLIYAYQQTNIAITGSGTFDGQAYHWATWTNLANPDWATLQDMVAQGVPVENRIFGAGHHLRLTMFEPYECTNVLVQGVTFLGSPFWTLHPTFCSNVTIQNVTVKPGQTNDDGCDPDSCTDVLIDGCSLWTNDDNFSLKAGHGADAVGLPPCQNVVIQNSKTVRSVWGGFTIGSNTGSNVKNVYVQNCQVGPCYYAYYIKSSSQNGGAVENVFIRSCTASTCKIFVNFLTDYDSQHGPTPPLYTNVNLENMSCDEATQLAFSIIGDARNPILYVSLSGIAVASAGAVQEVENALFISSSNITVAGKQVTIQGEL